MKIIFALCLLVFFTINNAAQNSFKSSSVDEVKILMNRCYLPIPEKEDGTFQTINQQPMADSNPQNTLPPPPDSLGKNKYPHIQFYTYEIRLKNTGSRIIRRVTWKYLFLDPNTNQQLGESFFVSDTNIAPGKTQNLKKISIIQPIKKIEVTQNNRKIKVKTIEKIFILNVE